MIQALVRDPRNHFVAFTGSKSLGLHLLRLVSRIEEGRSTAKLDYHDVTGVHRGRYVGPAIFTDVAEDSPLAQVEIFGPVLTVMRARNFNQALKIANRTD